MKDESRWSHLFDDLEAQAESLAGAQRWDEVAERTRIEIGALDLVDRLRPAEGQWLVVRCAGAGLLRGRLDRVGSDCLLLTEPSGAESLLPVAAVTGIAGLGRWSDAAPGGLDRRLGLRSALRALVRNRAAVSVLLVDGGSVAGTADRVGSDFLELAEHPTDEPRRPSSVLRVWTIPLHGVAVVRRPGR